MKVTKEAIKKETIVWVILVIITCIVTNIYNNNKPETKINNSYTKIYNLYMEANEVSKENIIEVQEILDLARSEMKDIKSKFKVEGSLLNSFNSLSTELDKLQEKIISKAKDNISKIQIAKKENKSYEKLEKETNEIILSLENGDSNRAKTAAENLKVLLKEACN